MSLHIIGGKFRGRALKTPKSSQTRPTLAILRKAVFDILQEDVVGTHFLDLYAGSGAMGLEALSRGAEHATFVEAGRDAFRCIEENTRALDVQSQCTLISYDANAALKKMMKKEQQFDIIYVDPPYDSAAKRSTLQEVISFVGTHHLLRTAKSRLFLEEADPATLKIQELSLTGLRYVDSRTFSRSTLHQFMYIPCTK